MRASIWLQKFDPAASFVVARSFMWASREQRPGEPFDKTSVPVRKLRLLYDARLIAMGAVPAFDPLAELPAPVAESTDPAPAVDEIVAAPASDPNPLHIKHVGKGRFAVMRGEERLTPEPLTKEKAEARLAELAAA